ncbi:DUF305 domain-containing protein [Sanguibacter antarcticus]|uniref:Uncharacterized protein (DUF305 family) n=1 Tax=Sanguibacter antarcticus TaxID=372484 RepID=A0A2A9E2H7_9MICO|nr:DUF305 domain-containing protein [Sanguibacter antarcticus]PFG32412.1 uncharacterized protein (DUF305 family) [Sanguibacter antarcticus]
MNTKTRIAAFAASLTLATALAACGDAAPEAESTPAAQETSQEAAEVAHNGADTEFAQMMIVHHEGAVEMADLAATNAESEEVKDLATEISAAQGPEIDTMTSWLESWGEETSPDDGMEGMDHGDMEMEGLDQEAVMAELGALTGTEFDRRFLELMTSHHEGAVGMAQEELDSGENADALVLAQTIIDAQTTEIATMQGMLDSF